MYFGHVGLQIGTSQGKISMLQNSHGEGSQVRDRVFNDCSAPELMQSFEHLDHSDQTLMPVGQSPSLQYSSSMFDLHAVSSMLLRMHVTVVTVLTPGPHCAEQCDLFDFQATNSKGSKFSVEIELILICYLSSLNCTMGDPLYLLIFLISFIPIPTALL